MRGPGVTWPGLNPVLLTLGLVIEPPCASFSSSAPGGNETTYLTDVVEMK